MNNKNLSTIDSLYQALREAGIKSPQSPSKQSSNLGSIKIQDDIASEKLIDPLAGEQAQGLDD